MHPSHFSSKTVRWRCGLALLAACIGCDSSTTISGIVSLDGKPLQITDGMRGTVVFQPASHQGPTLNGMIDASGRYTLAAGSETAVPPGVYLATVSAVEILPGDEEDAQQQGRRITPERYASAAESGLRVKVLTGDNHIDLDLATSDSSHDNVTPAEPTAELDSPESQSKEAPDSAE